MAAAAKKGRAMETKPELMTTTVRLRPDQWTALRAEAAARATQAEGGRADPRKADASALIRELIDAWIAKRKK